MRMWHHLVLVTAVTLLTTAIPAQNRIRVETSLQLHGAVAKARPGQRISLAPGSYGTGVRIVELAGKKGRPVVIEGADPKRPPVFEGGICALHLVDCQHVTLRNLTVRGCSGNGINVDDGGSIDSPARHIVLEEVAVLDTGPWGNHDGIKLSGVEDFIVRRCRIAGWGGSGIDMVGCHRGVIEDCTFEGRPGFSQSNGLQMKGGSRWIMVQCCFFRDAGHRSINAGGGTGLRFFRPPDARFEAQDITIAGNRFAGGQACVAFVNARNIRVHHNTIYCPQKWVLRILQETVHERFPPCREGIFEHNLVVFDSRVRTVVNVGPRTAPKTFVFRGNAWFGQGGAPRPRLPVAEVDGLVQVDPGLIDAGTATMRATSRDRRLRNVGVRAHRRAH